MDKPELWVFLIGLLLAIVFTVLNVKAGMLLTIVITALVGIPFGVTTMSNSISIGQAFSQLPITFGAIFTGSGFPALFSNVSRLPIVLVTIFAFSMSDTFDTIGTFIGTGRRSGIFSKEDEEEMRNGSGFSSKMDKALFADSIATSIGAIFGTSNTTNLCGIRSRHRCGRSHRADIRGGGAVLHPVHLLCTDYLRGTVRSDGRRSGGCRLHDGRQPQGD